MDQLVEITKQAESQLRMPGATLVTRLKVYDTVTPDGQRGGTPHIHLMCTEMYYVLSGSGAVELLDMKGFSRVEVGPDSALVFSPGTIHRLINPNGDLLVLVVMQNSGLPERGDNVVSFSDEWMADDARYTEAMTIQSVEDAHQRRDRGVEGFLQLKAAFDQDAESGRRALGHFYEMAAARTANLRAEWARIIKEGALAAAQISLDHLAALEDNQTDFLADAGHHLVNPGDFSKLGFCGELNRYFDPATLGLEGITQA
jgi:mannose-6-phosphate isomerase-like protein (cupin superfamily)